MSLRDQLTNALEPLDLAALEGRRPRATEIRAAREAMRAVLTFVPNLGGGRPYLPGRTVVEDANGGAIVQVAVDGTAVCLRCSSRQAPDDPTTGCQHTEHVRRMHADPGMAAIDAILEVIRTDEPPDGLTFQAWVWRVCQDARNAAAARDRQAAHQRAWEHMTPAQREAHAVALFTNPSTQGAPF